MILEFRAVAAALDELLGQDAFCGRLKWYAAPTAPNHFVSEEEEALAAMLGEMWVLQRPGGHLFAASPGWLDWRLALLANFADHPAHNTTTGPIIRKIGADIWQVEGDKAGVLARGPDLSQMLVDLWGGYVN